MDDPQEQEWGVLYDRIRDALRRFGTENAYGDGDYWIVDDNWGLAQHKVEVHNLKMLAPTIVVALQSLLTDLPDWDIMIGLSIPGTEGVWPPMGLIIRDTEIIDGLRREYFPKELQQLVYPGSRPGTDRD